MGFIFMFIVISLVFGMLRIVMDTVPASIISITLFVGWYMYNKHSSTVGLFEANYSVYSKAIEAGMNEDDACAKMLLTRYPNNHESINAIHEIIDLVDYKAGHHFDSPDEKAKILIYAIFCYENKIPFTNISEEMEKRYINQIAAVFPKISDEPQPQTVEPLEKAEVANKLAAQVNAHEDEGVAEEQAEETVQAESGVAVEVSNDPTEKNKNYASIIIVVTLLIFIAGALMFGMQNVHENAEPITYSITDTDGLMLEGVYEGDLTNSLPDGYGTWFGADGSTYEGQWASGDWHGEGIRIWANGSIYTGEYIGGGRDGYGILMHRNGLTYDGHWKSTAINPAGMPHGYGGLVDSEGNNYEGEWFEGYLLIENTADGKAKAIFAWNGGLYTGDWKNDLPNGQGFMVWPNGDEYTGEFKDGWLQGQGSMVYSNGDIFSGFFKEDFIHGEGLLISDQLEFEGIFLHGNAHGQGKLTMADGIFYEGLWENNYMKLKDLDDETVLAIHYSGSSYKGNWDNGLPNGVGIKTWPDGTEYSGEWANGMRHGQGTLNTGQGQKFIGEWFNDFMHGKGEAITADGDKYVGDFKYGLFNGQGELVLIDGASYSGNFEDGNFHGQGTLTFSDGDEYTGDFSLGEFHGYGTYTYSDGSIQKGRWENGEYVGQ